MIRIQKDISVVDAMDAILYEYTATPPSDYKKQLRIQIRNTAMQDEGFSNAFERVIEDEFSDIPRLDEIEDFINEMPPTLADILDQYEIREKAKRMANHEHEFEDVWCGHEMTYKQSELCEKVWVSVSDWCKDIPPDCDISENMEKTYERETGKSCVNWRDSESWAVRDTLPRSEDYTTEGWTSEFEHWATDLIVKAVVEAGCETDKEVADYIRKECPVVQG